MLCIKCFYTLVFKYKLSRPDEQEKATFFFPLAVYYMCFIDWPLISMFSKGTLFGEAQQRAKMLVYHHTEKTKEGEHITLCIF